MMRCSNSLTAQKKHTREVMKNANNSKDRLRDRGTSLNAGLHAASRKCDQNSLNNDHGPDDDHVEGDQNLYPYRTHRLR